MRTDLRIHARPGLLPDIHAAGGLAARRTGPDTVHLIGTAATPLGGDEVFVTVVVEPGARLIVRSVAATLALPGRITRKSVAHWTFEIGGELDFDPEPTVVAGGADHESRTRLTLADRARVRLRERVQIGRSGEESGCWTGEFTADIGDVPLLRHRLELGADTATDDPLAAPRALESELRYPDDRPAETTGLTAARLPLAAGGSLYTRTSTALTPVG
ncbi:urease accessory protein UreD [Nocardia sp. NPDC004068]|uniref:urease accessory protein UreD n=1 Tax=Nocardia sp. NPDC004068 TaxID=3364303 RepID=UPI0036AE803D